MLSVGGLAGPSGGMMPLQYALVVGLLAGLHASIWGMYKDAPHEGFTWPTFFRSTITGLILAPLVARLFDMPYTGPGDLVVLFGVTYAFERGVAEIYKTFIRVEDQSKYFIPMQLSVFGKPVQSYGMRLLVGLGYVSVLLTVILVVNWLDTSGRTPLPFVATLFVASAFGWISAFGGAWKDAPLEGFQTLKFFRSPAMAMAYAAATTLLTDRLLFVTLCAIGYTIATTESYKTFFRLHVPRGKFQGKPVTHPEMLSWRHRFVPVYVVIWLLVISHWVLAVIR
jgi:hypothetical protein